MTSKPLRILVADDHAMVLEMFQQFLANLADFSVEIAPDLDAALVQIEQQGPFDLVLVDLNMPGMEGLSGLGKAIEYNGGKPVGLLTSNPSSHVVTELLEMGGAGIVLKTVSLKNLANEIRFMANGGRFIPIELIEREKTKSREISRTALSEREMAVLTSLAEGKSNREIGSTLGLAEATVKMHMKAICTKLGASNRTQAVIMARDMNLL